MSAKRLKVTDKRMFTPEGELREEYSFLEQNLGDATAGASAAAEPAPAAPAPEAAAPVSRPAAPQAQAPEVPPEAAPEVPGVGESDGEPLEIPMDGMRRAGFGDLVAMLAEPIAIYLGQAPLPDGTVQEDLDMARLHIDLLDVLRRKTAGNLSARESAYLDNVLYQLRMLYVQKRG